MTPAEVAGALGGSIVFGCFLCGKDISDDFMVSVNLRWDAMEEDLGQFFACHRRCLRAAVHPDFREGPLFEDD